ncbi:MAG: hypothetical protein JST75_06210 [Bacteroidetes bacterium]|nr:hypothetical protein [Bacteroidota bacterium]
MATSLPSASSIGILANGTDQTAALNTAFANANYAGILFDYSPPASVTITGTVNCQGKIISFINGNKLIGSGTVGNCKIDAPYYSQIFSSSLTVNPVGTNGKYYSLKWSGATGDGSTDDYAALQQDINNCVYNGICELFLPSGVYSISKGLLFRLNSTGRPGTIAVSNFLGNMRLSGVGSAEGGTNGGLSWIKCANAASFAVGMQRVKGFRVENIATTGVNTGLQSYTQYQIIQDPSTTFLSNSSRDNFLSPHAGFVVDPFGGSAVGAGDRYPDFTSYYIDEGNGGSTDVVIKDCTSRTYTVDYCMSPHGSPQNCDAIKIVDCWGDYAKSAVSTGQSQNRSVFIENFKSWGACKYIFDCRNYGDGTSCPPEVLSCNIAGGNRYLCTLSNFVSKGLIIRNAHIESLGSFGGSFTGPIGTLIIEDSWINIVGGLPTSVFGGTTSINSALTLFQGATLKVTNSFFSQYGASYHLPIGLYCPLAIFENVSFDFIPINNYAANTTTFKDCSVGLPFGDGLIIGGGVSAAQLHTSSLVFTWDMKLWIGVPRTRIRKKIVTTAGGIKDVNVIPLSSAVTISNINNANLTAQFTLSTSSVDFKSLDVGDVLLFGTTDEFSNTVSYASFGVVNSKNSSTGVVVIGGTFAGIAAINYSLSIYRYDYIIPILMLGNITSGSNVITGVLIEGGTSTSINWPITLPHFPAGTKIVSYGAGTITVSNNATITENNVAIISSNWIGEEVGVPNTADPYLLGYKKGDIIWNNRSDLNPTVTYWMCKTNGITNTSSLPVFQAYP